MAAPSMRDWQSLAGKYIGRQSVRPGKEESLTPAELKRFVKNAEVVPLELFPNRSFNYKAATKGSCELREDRIVFKPTELGGQTREGMEAAAMSAGRAFTLGWLFNPFELIIEGADLVSNESQTVATRFTREG